MSSRLFASIVTGATLIVAVGLRTISMADSLWLDELHTSWVASGSFSEVTSRASAGNQTPVYFWLMWAAVHLAGHREIVLRLPSLVFGIVSLVLLANRAKQWFGSRSVSWLVLGLGAIDPHLVYYSCEARPYALLQLLAVIHLGMTYDRLQCATLGQRLAWLIVGWLIFYTHITGLLLLGVEGVMVLAAIRGWPGFSGGSTAAHGGSSKAGEKSQFARWSIDAAILLAGCVLSYTQLLSVFGRRENWRYFIHPSGIHEIWKLFPCDVYVGQPMMLAIGIFIVVWLGALLGDKRKGTMRFPSRSLGIGMAGAVLAGLGYVIPVGVAWLATRYDVAPLFHRRYTWVAVNSLLLAPVAIGVLLRGERIRLLYTVLAFALSLQYFAQWPAEHWTRHSREDWRSATTYIEAQIPREVPILLRAGLIEDDALNREADSLMLEAYCRFPVSAIYDVTADGREVVSLPSRRDPDQADFERIVELPNEVLFVSRGSREKADRCIQQLTQLAEARSQRLGVLSRIEFGGVWLFQIRIAEPETVSTDRAIPDLPSD